jgi:hypothetical protein
LGLIDGVGTDRAPPASCLGDAIDEKGVDRVGRTAGQVQGCAGGEVDVGSLGQACSVEAEGAGLDDGLSGICVQAAEAERAAPFFTTFLVPEMIPEKVSEVGLATVSVPEPRNTLPLPLMERTVSLKLFRSRMAAVELVVTSEASGITPEAPSLMRGDGSVARVAIGGVRENPSRAV